MSGVMNWILKAGVQEGMDEADVERIVLTNRLGFFAFLFTTAYIFCYFAFDLHLVGRSQVPFVAIYSLIPLLSHNKKFDLARILFFVSSIMQIFMICIMFL
ncbi:MAG: hypothetical protein IAF38_04880 [Bacteroidia bacterium]|nr:hypothetical protein [Bacteroidia bacterium]